MISIGYQALSLNTLTPTPAPTTLLQGTLIRRVHGAQHLVYKCPDERGPIMVGKEYNQIWSDTGGGQKAIIRPVHESSR